MYTVSLIDWDTDITDDTFTPSSEELYIYDPITPDDGLALVESNLHIEASKAGSFECSLPCTNYGYGRIIKGLTRLVVRKEEKVIFMGRVVTEDRDLYLNEAIKAEGALAYLNDSLSEKKTFVNVTLYYLLNEIFTKHNAKFSNEPWKKFYISQANCHVNFAKLNAKGQDEDTLASYSINFDKNLDLVLELVDLANGIIKYTYNETNGGWDVYIYDKYDLPLGSQPIEFGTNLMDLVQNYDKTDICTVIAPFGGELNQISKEIGDAVAGDGISGSGAEWKPNYIYVRDKENISVKDSGNNYHFYEAMGPGYWSVYFNIAAYNNAHPNEHIKKLYVSWRGYQFVTNEGEHAPANYIEDCAWRVYDSTNDVLGYHEFGSEAGFKSGINEEIDLTDPQYLDATAIVMCGWGGTVKPLIRRDAIIVEQQDLLSIETCDAFGPDENSLKHDAGSPYLYSVNMLNAYGRIEKRLDYSIEDQNVPVTEWSYPYDDHHGNKATFYTDSSLGYDVGNGQDPDYESAKGNYKILPIWNSGSGSSCIEYELPPIGSAYRPKGVFISSREKNAGVYSYNNTNWLVNGQWVVLDDSDQVLAYQSADIENSAWRSIKDFYLDLSDPAYYGAHKIRVGGFGSVIGVDIRPSDDNYSANKLMEQAKLYFTTTQWEKVVIEATAIDLNMTSSDWERFDICTKVSVVSEFHGMESFLPLTALDIRLDNLEDNTVKLGYDSEEYLSTQLSKRKEGTS